MPLAGLNAHLYDRKITLGLRDDSAYQMERSRFSWAVNETDYKPEGRRQAAHTVAAHKEVADRREEDKFCTPQALERSTCRRLQGMGAVLPLCEGNISSGGTDRSKAEVEEPHKWAVREARTSLAGVRKDWGEAYMQQRTTARVQQQLRPEQQTRKWGSLGPIPYTPEKPEERGSIKIHVYLFRRYRCSNNTG